MSHTFRHIPADEHLAELKGWESPSTFIRQMPDGKRSMAVEIIRDNRATGLRSHRADRREAKETLKDPENDSLPAGKMRRYSLQYGKYLW